MCLTYRQICGHKMVSENATAFMELLISVKQRVLSQPWAHKDPCNFLTDCSE